MYKAVTQYSVTGKRGGYTLQWIGDNCPTWVIGPKQTHAWYRYKKDAVNRAEELNKNI